MSLTRIRIWFSGWRQDLDGWWVRARRATDPDLNALDRSDIGFVEEACIAVRTPEQARAIDREAYVPPRRGRHPAKVPA